MGADRFRPPLHEGRSGLHWVLSPRSRNTSLIELGRATLSTVATDLQAGLVLIALALEEAHGFVKKRRLVTGFWGVLEAPWSRNAQGLGGSNFHPTHLGVSRETQDHLGGLKQEHCLFPLGLKIIIPGQKLGKTRDHGAAHVW